MAMPPGFPTHWRLCQIQQSADLRGTRLDEGLWILGFTDQPPPMPDGSAREVELPDGAVAAVRVLVTQSANEAWRLHGGARSALSLSEVLVHQIAAKISVTNLTVPTNSHDV